MEDQSQTRNYLDLVTENYESNKLFLTNNIISYIDSKGEKQLILNLESKDRPLYMSELFDRLNNRKWNIPIRRVIEDDKLAFYKIDILSEENKIDSFDFNNNAYIVSDISYIKKFEEATKEDINDFMEKVYKYFNKNGLSLFNSSKIIVDILNSSVTINLIEDNYTDTIDLNQLINKINSPNVSCKIDLSVSYTFKNSTDILTKDTTFKAFEYKGTSLDTKLDCNNLLINLNEVEVEYIDGIIKAIPLSDDIEECIISNCIATYGNI